MRYIVFDLEFNQAWNFEENKSMLNTSCPFEIIQIGAIQLNERFETLSNFNRLVKPELYSNLHPYVKEITGLTIEDLNNAKPFKEVYEEFVQFLNSSSILCVWGMSDMKELSRNIKYHKLDPSLLPKQCINIQRHASKYFRCPKGSVVGLHNAVEFLNIPHSSKFHDAFNDAYYTAEVFKHIYTENIKPVEYDLGSDKKLVRYNKKKTKLDAHSLIKQFEKMFNREMTPEEHSIIKLSYMMGRTNQFQIEASDQ